MLTTTGTLGVNAAFLQEIKEDGRELRELFVRAGSAVGNRRQPAQHPRQIVETLHCLCDQLALHFALEEAYGYFDDAVDVAPQLSELADELRLEHESLFVELCRIVEHAERILYHESSAYLLGILGDDFDRFRRRFRRHESRETDLILQAFDDDLGVVD